MFEILERLLAGFAMIAMGVVVLALAIFPGMMVGVTDNSWWYFAYTPFLTLLAVALGDDLVKKKI